MCRSRGCVALVKFDFEVLSHHADQVPNDLQVDIRSELGQAKEDGTQMHRLRMLLQDFKEDSQSLLYDCVVVFRHFSKVETNGICFFQFAKELLLNISILLELSLLPEFGQLIMQLLTFLCTGINSLGLSFVNEDFVEN